MNNTLRIPGQWIFAPDKLCIRVSRQKNKELKEEFLVKELRDSIKDAKYEEKWLSKALYLKWSKISIEGGIVLILTARNWKKRPEIPTAVVILITNPSKRDYMRYTQFLREIESLLERMGIDYTFDAEAFAGTNDPEWFDEAKRRSHLLRSSARNTWHFDENTKKSKRGVGDRGHVYLNYSEQNRQILVYDRSRLPNIVPPIDYPYVIELRSRWGYLSRKRRKRRKRITTISQFLDGLEELIRSNCDFRVISSEKLSRWIGKKGTRRLKYHSQDFWDKRIETKTTAETIDFIMRRSEGAVKEGILRREVTERIDLFGPAYINGAPLHFDPS